MFLKGKGSVLRHKKSIPKFGSLMLPERQPKKPQRVTLFKKNYVVGKFSTIIVCIIKNEGLKFVLRGNVFFLRIGLIRILSIKIVQYSKYGVKIRILMFFQVCF